MCKNRSAKMYQLQDLEIFHFSNQDAELLYKSIHKGNPKFDHVIFVLGKELKNLGRNLQFEAMKLLDVVQLGEALEC